jgi:hypothetical protein
MAMNDKQLDALANSCKWRNIHQRLAALLDVLERAGCFILRRGTIESYYRFADAQTSLGKPSAALEEVSGFSEEGPAFVEANYADLVRGLSRSFGDRRKSSCGLASQEALKSLSSSSNMHSRCANGTWSACLGPCRLLITESSGEPVRALRHAADTQRIDEARAVRDLVLAVAAPALGNISTGVSEIGLNVLVSTLVGETASILKLSTEVGPDGAQHLVINLNSQVLNVSGFPIRLRQGLDPILQVDDQLGIVRDARSA